MKIRYVNPEGSDETSTQGYSFGGGQWVEVSDAVGSRLARNPFFEVFQESRTNSDENVPTTEAPKKRGRKPKLKLD